MTATRVLFALLDGWEEVPPLSHLDPQAKLAEIGKLIGQGLDEQAERLLRSEIAAVRPVFRAEAIGAIDSMHGLSDGLEGFTVSKYLATLHVLVSEIHRLTNDRDAALRQVHMSSLASPYNWPAIEAALTGIAETSTREAAVEFANSCLGETAEHSIHLLRTALRLKREGRQEHATGIVEALLRSPQCVAERAAASIEGAFVENPDGPFPSVEELQARLQSIIETMKSGDYEGCVEHSLFYLSWVPDDAARWSVLAIVQQQFISPGATRVARMSSDPPTLLVPLPRDSPRSSGAMSLRMAERCFGYALQLGLRNQVVFHQLANTKLLLGSYQEAVEFGYLAARMAPDDAEILCDLGQALSFNHELDKAERILRQALHLSDDLPLIHFNLASVLARTGRREEANSFYRRAKELSDVGDEV